MSPHPTHVLRNRRVGLVLALAGLAGTGALAQSGDQEGFRFRTGVELINVTATVTDGSGRFVPGLEREDFRVYENDVVQEITHFSNERVPVSLGIVLDTSGSMAGEKMDAARDAIDRFLYDLLAPEDEVFLYRFSNYPILAQDWTTDRDRLSRALRGVHPNGGTALYDTVAEAVPLAQSGRHRKKALVIISDGNDTSSRTDVDELKQLIRETEVLVYAIGIDGRSQPTLTRGRQPRFPIPIPLPIPGRGPRFPIPFPPGGGSGGGTVVVSNDGVNRGALRDITDDSGGRTEIIASARDLDPATASIADELSKQYYLGYSTSLEQDGRWHTIRVEVPGSDRYLVRARRGYIASP